MVRKTQPDSAKTPPSEKAAPKREAGTAELAERIERLEQRLDESILGDDGLAKAVRGVDPKPSGDTLQRAVRRSNIKRGSRKD